LLHLLATDLEMHQTMLFSGRADQAVNGMTETENQDQQLLEAAEEGDLEQVKAALAHGADIEARDEDGDTAICLAVAEGHMDVVDMLLEVGADVNVRGSERFTLLHWAAYGGNALAVDKLVKLGLRVDARAEGDDLWQTTPLCRAAMQKGSVTVEALLSHGADPNIPDQNGWTPLHFASVDGNQAAVECLLSHGAIPSLRGFYGRTPRDLAVNKGYEAVAQILMAAEERAALGSPIRELPRKINFSRARPRCDREYHVDENDISVVLMRLPEELWARLRAVHFNDRSHGARSLGYVTGARNEISLSALPPRMSLTRFIRFRKSPGPRQFGAKRGAQWPHLAVRRFLLYDVFLHELGHIQAVDEEARNPRRKYASETKAQDFADKWRRQLWLYPFDHPDPVHNPPTEDELLCLQFE
jgi:hypothetical protein